MAWRSTAWVDAHVDGPVWLNTIRDSMDGAHMSDLTRHDPPPAHGRHAAVLVLFGEDVHGPDVLLIKRAADLRAHAGQPAFPGGAVDPGDRDAQAAALREASEEAGVDPSGVRIFAHLPDIWVPVTNYVVTPVVAWWAEPVAVEAKDRQEVASVHRVPLSALVDPANRVRVRHPSGYIGPAFVVEELLIWGFTAGLLDVLLDRAGLAAPWDDQRVIELDEGGVR